MTPEAFLRDAIDPACDALGGILNRDMGGDPARSLVLAICLQESALEHRRQVGEGGKILATLARGMPQFERGGGVKGVMTHAATKDALAEICRRLVIPFDQASIHEAMAWNDLLAASMARLLLFSDPAAIPPVTDTKARWAMYERNWRPGKPRPDHWPQAHERALQAVRDLRARPADFIDARYEPAPMPVMDPIPEADMTKNEVAAIVAAALAEHARQGVPVPAGQLDVAAVTAAAPSPRKPGTLTVNDVVVDLPKMNRSWTSGEFWLQVLAYLGTAAVFLAPLIEPQLDRVQASPWLASIPLGSTAFAMFRQWYKNQRVKTAADLATKQIVARGQ